MTELRARIEAAKRLQADGCECGGQPCPTWRREFAWLVEQAELGVDLGAALMRDIAEREGEAYLGALLARIAVGKAEEGVTA